MSETITERPIPDGTDLALRNKRGERVAVTLNPDGSVTFKNVDTEARPEWLASISIDGCSARVLREWLHRELVA